jgi:hypothetical protein
MGSQLKNHHRSVSSTRDAPFHLKPDMSGTLTLETSRGHLMAIAVFAALSWQRRRITRSAPQLVRALRLKFSRILGWIE